MGERLSETDLHRLRAALGRKRDDLLAARRANEPGERGIAEREAEAGDEAEQLIEQEAALRIGAFDATLLADVEHALARIDDGTYGTSEESGAPIPLERLEAIPWARRTAAEEQLRQRKR